RGSAGGGELGLGGPALQVLGELFTSFHADRPRAAVETAQGAFLATHLAFGQPHAGGERIAAGLRAEVEVRDLDGHRRGGGVGDGREGDDRQGGQRQGGDAG